MNNKRKKKEKKEKKNPEENQILQKIEDKLKINLF
jgi:hypothetical protein